MIEIDDKNRMLLLEAIEELMYKVSLQLESFRGKPLSKERKALTIKQNNLEKIQHEIHLSAVSEKDKRQS